jgi:hypothetical protein
MRSLHPCLGLPPSLTKTPEGTSQLRDLCKIAICPDSSAEERRCKTEILGCRRDKIFLLSGLTRKANFLAKMPATGFARPSDAAMRSSASACTRISGFKTVPRSARHVPSRIWIVHSPWAAPPSRNTISISSPPALSRFNEPGRNSRMNQSTNGCSRSGSKPFHPPVLRRTSRSCTTISLNWIWRVWNWSPLHCEVQEKLEIDRIGTRHVRKEFVTPPSKIGSNLRPVPRSELPKGDDKPLIIASAMDIQSAFEMVA